ncbi:MAG: NAD(P)/FAD-dependent oxidoreductase [Candidatus Omnitrophica bacterium]|nr:NAD(P)/FAD-dependent oxidoreductase [Candidatus Omnitrophota bacterium]
MKNFYINTLTNPKGLKKDQYDVIIIGAGIGGLVCGCYLAKAGLKVLIVEKNDKPGGYCQSFERDGYRFDIITHGLTGFRRTSPIKNILDKLNLFRKVNIARADPADVIIYGDRKIHFWNDTKRTIDEFKEIFPHEAKGIEEFFKFLSITNFTSLYYNYRNDTFDKILNNYFKDKALKGIFTSFLGVMGLPTFRVSAISATILYREVIFDGGYYPIGGVGKMSYALSEIFKEYGGNCLISVRVNRLKIKNKKVEGVILDKNEFVSSKYVISACDGRQTFFDLIGKNNLPKRFINNLEKLLPSTTVFIVFLGVNRNDQKNIKEGRAIWYTSDYTKLDEIYFNIYKGHLNLKDDNILCIFNLFGDTSLISKDKDAITLIISVPYKTPQYWLRNKEQIALNLINRATNVIPYFLKNITVKKIITPLSLYEWTLNYRGAVRGWAAIPEQISRDKLYIETPINNLFLTGHWLTFPGGGGIPIAIYLGYNTAKWILKFNQ